MFKVGIFNGESCLTYEFFQNKCINILKNKAKEGDRIILYSNLDKNVDEFAKKFGIETVTVLCDWKRDGKNALKVVNDTILSSVDALIVFDDGGTTAKYVCNAAKTKTLPIRRIILE